MDVSLKRQILWEETQTSTTTKNKINSILKEGLANRLIARRERRVRSYIKTLFIMMCFEIYYHQPSPG